MAIAIIDYGMANLRSVQKAFAAVGESAEIVSTPEQIEKADHVVLPGVGAFCDAIATLRSKNLADPIINHIKKDKPMLGICLGLQMLFGLKVPHMGWNQLNRQNESPLLKDLPEGAGVYFVHGYHVVPDDAAVIATTTDYGRPFVSSIRRGNLMATQFHPEKSQKVGLQILANFARV
jgi:glutamine amidotransferase